MCKCEKLDIVKFNLLNSSNYSLIINFRDTWHCFAWQFPLDFPCMPCVLSKCYQVSKLSQETSQRHKCMNILPFFRICRPCCWQVGEEQTGRMVSTHYLAVIGSRCKNCSEVSSLEERIFIDLSHTFWHGKQNVSIIWDGNTQFTRRGLSHCSSLSLTLLLKQAFVRKCE